MTMKTTKAAIFFLLSFTAAKAGALSWNVNNSSGVANVPFYMNENLYIRGPQPFVYVRPTGGDDTSTVAAAITRAGVNGTIKFSSGTFQLSSTLTGLTGQVWEGVGAPGQTTFFRTGDYGDTVVFGSSSTSPGNVNVSNIWFVHSFAYSPGDTSLANKVTTGAHLRIWNSQPSKIKNCWFWRMQYGIVYQGGTLATLEDNHFQQIYDSSYTAVQEGIANVYIATSPTSFATDFRFARNSFTGNGSAARDVRYVTADGTTTVHISQAVGPQYNILVHAVEGLDIMDNYISGGSVNNLLLAPLSGKPCLDIRIHGNFIDSGNGYQVALSPSSGATVFATSIYGNTFNGEANSQGALYVNSIAGATPGTYNMTFSGNTAFAHVGTSVLLFGAHSSDVFGNTLTDYNCYNAGTTDQSYINGIYAAQATAETNISNPTTGTNGTYVSNGTVSIAAGLTNVRRFDSSIMTGLAASRAMVTDSSARISTSAVTATELGYVSGVTSAIQTQIGTKAPTASPTFTGTATFDTSTLIVNSSAHKVIIGAAATPAELLHVSGSGSNPSIMLEDTSQGSNLKRWRLATSITAAGDLALQTRNDDGTAKATRFYLTNAGALTMSNYGAGAATFDSSGNVTSVSDLRLKNVVGPFKSGLANLLKIDPISYRWKPESGMETRDTYHGFSAQNLKSAIPEIVFQGKNGTYSFEDRGVLAALVNAIKELSKKLDDLTARIAVLEKKK